MSDILSSLTTLNIEGADPTSYCVFETVHPTPAGQIFKDNYQVPRAIGYMIEFDPKSAKCDGNIQLRTSRTVHELNSRDIG